MAALDHRETVRRQHRQLSLFLVIQAWTKALDGVVLSREAITRLLGLERWEPDRIPLLIEDLKEFFPFHRERSKPGEPYYLEISRKKFSHNDGPDLGPVGCESTPLADLEKSWNDHVPLIGNRGAFCEEFISLYLAVVSRGNTAPGWCSVIETPEEVA